MKSMADPTTNDAVQPRDSSGRGSFDFSRVYPPVSHRGVQSPLHQTVTRHDIHALKLWGCDMDNKMVLHPCFIHDVHFSVRDLNFNQINQICNTYHINACLLKHKIHDQPN